MKSFNYLILTSGILDLEDAVYLLDAIFEHRLLKLRRGSLSHLLSISMQPDQMIETIENLYYYGRLHARIRIRSYPMHNILLFATRKLNEVGMCNLINIS